MKRKRAAKALGLATLALVLSGCGVGIEATPTVVNRHDVPYHLLQSSTTTTALVQHHDYVTVFLEGTQPVGSTTATVPRLVAVSSAVSSPVTVRGVLAALEKGPTPTQAANGLKSPISTAAPLSLTSVGTTTVTVSVGASFTKLAEQDQAIAAAQLVYTLTALPAVGSIAIRIDGKHAKVPTGSGTLSGGPLDRSEYATLAPI